MRHIISQLFMQRHNLNISLDEDFLLIGIHSSMEDYKLAFFINKHLKLKLKRKKEDLVVFNQNGNLNYQVYEYCDNKNDDVYYLIKNICKTRTEKFTSAGSLFEANFEEKTDYLIPEHKKTDYVLKIVIEDKQSFEEIILKKLENLPNISTYYIINQDKLKNTNNLKFD